MCVGVWFCSKWETLKGHHQLPRVAMFHVVLTGAVSVGGVFPVAFLLYDVDGDGRISHRDLMAILNDTVTLVGQDDRDRTKVSVAYAPPTIPSLPIPRPSSLEPRCAQGFTLSCVVADLTVAV